MWLAIESEIDGKVSSQTINFDQVERIHSYSEDGSYKLTIYHESGRPINTWNFGEDKDPRDRLKTNIQHKLEARRAKSSTDWKFKKVKAN